MTDARMIFVLATAVITVILMDDGAGQRWCDTYQFCEDQSTHAEAADGIYYEIEKL